MALSLFISYLVQSYQTKAITNEELKEASLELDSQKEDLKEISESLEASNQKAALLLEDLDLLKKDLAAKNLQQQAEDFYLQMGFRPKDEGAVQVSAPWPDSNLEEENQDSLSFRFKELLATPH